MMDYYLIGKNVEDSYSKIIHNEFNNNQYELVSVNKDEVIKIFEKKLFKGINITKPYKELALTYVDELDELAKRINAINIVVNKNGKLIGYNSDYLGLKYLLTKNNIDLTNKNVAILGTGGSAKMIYTLASDLKANNIIYVSRNKCDEHIISYDDLYNHDVDILFNATPVGQRPLENKKVLVDLTKLKKLEVVIDLNYNPFNTRLMQKANELNIKSINGLDMLIEQARISEELFFEKEISTTINDEVKKKINSKKNIVLIGMPYAGKSEIGKNLAKMLNRPLIDVDEIIESSLNKSVEDIINENGVETFRKLELNIIKKCGGLTGTIISTGGGVITNKKNMEILKSNGIIFAINRKKELITFDNSRPLCQNSKAFDILYQKRKNLYAKYKDYEIINNETLLDASKEIISIYEKDISD